MACTGTYIVNQTDVDTGKVSSKTTVTTLSPTRNAVGATKDESVVLTGTTKLALGKKIAR